MAAHSPLPLPFLSLPLPLPLLLLLLFASCAAAQDVWGVSGRWEQVATTGPSPQGSRWHSAATTAGCLFITGGAGAAGNATFQLDTQSNAWTQYPTLPAGFLAPAVSAFGGMLVLFGGENSFGATDSQLLISTTNYSGGWRDGSIPGSSFGARNGHKVVIFGGNAYLTGGWNGAAGAYFNDLYGLDLNSYLLSTSTLNGQVPGWVQIFANNAPGAMTPRSAFSWDVYSNTLVAFGGIWANAAVNPSQRLLYNDAWLWAPGNVAQLAPMSSAQGWVRMNAVGQNGGPLPLCRYGHASGVYGDQLFVFGGLTWDACGAFGGPSQLNDLWALNLPSQEWAQVAQTSPWPSPRGVPAGLFVGRYLYVFGGDGVSADTWRWSPTFSPTGGCGGGGGGGGGDGGTLSAPAIAALAASSIFSLASLGATLYLLRGLAGPSAPRASASAMGSVYENL